MVWHIDEATAAAGLPPIPAAGVEGWFQEADPVAGTEKVHVRAWWLNMVQQELSVPLNLAGIPRSKTANNQLGAAIATIARRAGGANYTYVSQSTQLTGDNTGHIVIDAGQIAAGSTLEMKLCPASVFANWGVGAVPWFVIQRSDNNTGASVVVTLNAGEAFGLTYNNASVTFGMQPGERITVFSDGVSLWYAYRESRGRKARFLWADAGVQALGGNFSWLPPVGVYSAIGRGFAGGAGGGTGGASAGGGGGGGGGGFEKRLACLPGLAITGPIGAPGNGGAAAGANGQPGGSTGINGYGCYATGGSPGISGSSSPGNAGGDGGQGYGGDRNLKGQPGNDGSLTANAATGIGGMAAFGGPGGRAQGGNNTGYPGVDGGGGGGSYGGGGGVGGNGGGGGMEFEQ